MAPKRASPLDEPPTASSSSEEEEEEEKVPSSDGEEGASSEEDGDDEPPKPKPSSNAAHIHNKPPSNSQDPPPPLNSAQPSQSMSDSDSGSDSEHRWVANPRVKPIASKPMEDTPNPKPKPKPKKAATSSATARSTTKRPTENNVSRQQKDSKRAKKTVSDVTADGQAPAKANDGKKGEDSQFSRPHENKAKSKSSAKARKDQKEGGAKTLASLNPKEPEKMDIDKACGSMLSLSEMIRFDQSLGLPGLSEDVIKRGLELIGASKRAELEERWKDLRVAELELYVKCAQLVSDQAKLIWEAYKASNH